MVSVVESSVQLLKSSQRLVYVVRDGPLLSSVSVRCATLAGSARPFVDYNHINNSLLTFGVGQQWRTVNITTLDGGQPVPDLTFYVVLFSAVGKIMQRL